MSFSLRLFGGASLEGPDGPLTGRATQRHRLALLALLASASRGGISRDKLIAYLWEDGSNERTRRSLSDSVYRINKALGSECLVAAGEELRLDPERLPSDVAEFRDALEREQWQRAIHTYSGPFLDGFHLPNAFEFERWLTSQRDELARQHAGALESLADEQAATGDLQAAATTWQRRAALDRYDSRVALRLMEAMEASGNRAGALRHARVHANLFEEEFGTGPDPEVQALAERLRCRPSTVAAAEDEPQMDAPREGSRPIRPSGRRRERMRPARAALFAGIGALTVGAAWLGWSSMSAPPLHTSPSIAVLPFENLSADEDGLYFADGVTEDVLTRLSMIDGFSVIARASVLPYRESGTPVPVIAEELGVGYLVQGSVRHSSGEVRITAQLIDTRTNANIWAETYDRRLEDIFAVQSDIARRVAEALEAELGPAVAAQMDRAPTDDLVAYNLYLRGRYFWHLRTEEGLRRSARFFEDAAARDPEFARAWAGVADAYAVLAFYDYLPPGEAYPKARDAAVRALAVDESLAEAHASLGYITLYNDWDAAGAERAFRRAIELNPSYSVGHQWYANHLVATARFPEAVREMSRARETNPLSLIANLALGWVYYYAGRYDEAVKQCDLALEMDDEWDLAYLWRGLAFEELGRIEEAVVSFRRAVELSGGSGITTAALAHAYAVTGATHEARALLADLLDARDRGRYRPSFEIAKVYTALGEPAEAIQWLERAYQERSHSMVFLEVDPQLAPLAREPAFRKLVERVGFEG